MANDMSVADFLFEHRARGCSPDVLADILDRLVWIMDDNGEQICTAVEGWLRSSDRSRVEVALGMREVFPFRDAREMETVLSNVGSTWPDLAARCNSIIDLRRKQNPSEYHHSS